MSEQGQKRETTAEAVVSEEREVIERIVARGDLMVLGLPVADIGAVYQIVQEWRLLGGNERSIHDMRERAGLKKAVAIADDLLRRLSEWDMFYVSPAGTGNVSDAEYWQKEISRARTALDAFTTDDISDVVSRFDASGVEVE